MPFQYTFPTSAYAQADNQSCFQPQSKCTSKFIYDRTEFDRAQYAHLIDGAKITVPVQNGPAPGWKMA